MRFENLELLASAARKNPSTVDSLSATQGFIGDAGGPVLSTIVGGQSGQDRSNPILGDVHNLVFISTANGWGGASTGLYRTTNSDIS